MTIKHFLFIALVSLSLPGCDVPTNEDWKDVVKAADNECPDITGTYSIMDQPGYLMLAGHYEKPERNWSVMSISGNPQVELQITLYEADTGISYQSPIKRIRNRDYECKAGMLETAWPYMAAPINRSEEHISDDDLVEKSLSFAKNKKGDLVLRSNTHSWKGISVWCGDGCKYVPIPLTGRTSHRWRYWPSSAIPTPITATENAIATQQDIPKPEDDNPEGMAKYHLKKLTPKGVRLDKVFDSKDHWRAVFRGDTNGLLALHETLQTTADIQLIDVKINAIGAQQKELQLDFRLPPTQAEREAKKAAEAEQLRKAQEHEAKDRVIVKQLLPCFPAGMTLTFYHSDENGFLAEVRHKDGDAFYQLIVNAMASGHFLRADIKARKYVDNENLQVVDVLLVPKSGDAPRP
jgi:hypothetical protein